MSIITLLLPNRPTSLEIVGDNAKGHRPAATTNDDNARPLTYRRTRTGSFVPTNNSRRARSPPPQQRPAFESSKAASLSSPAMPKRHLSVDYYCDPSSSSSLSSFASAICNKNETVIDEESHSDNDDDAATIMTLNRLFRPVPMPQNVSKPERQVSLDQNDASLDDNSPDAPTTTTTTTTTAAAFTHWLQENSLDLLHDENDSHVDGLVDDDDMLF